MPVKPFAFFLFHQCGMKDKSYRWLNNDHSENFNTFLLFGCDVHFFAYNSLPLRCIGEKRKLTPVLTKGNILCYSQMAVTVKRKLWCKVLKFSECISEWFISHFMLTKHKKLEWFCVQLQNCRPDLIWHNARFPKKDKRKRKVIFFQNPENKIFWPQKHTYLLQHR